MKASLWLWIFRIVPAVILLQTLFFKFTAAPEAVHIFSTLGVEPYGRIALGIAEFITAILLLVPRTSQTGAVIGILLMIGAILAHVFILGIEVQDDGGKLFILALITLLGCALYLGYTKFRILNVKN